MASLLFLPNPPTTPLTITNPTPSRLIRLKNLHRQRMKYIIYLSNCKRYHQVNLSGNLRRKSFPNSKSHLRWPWELISKGKVVQKPIRSYHRDSNPWESLDTRPRGEPIRRWNAHWILFPNSEFSQKTIIGSNVSILPPFVRNKALKMV